MWDDKTDEELVRIILSSGVKPQAMVEARAVLNELLLRHYGWIMRVSVAELRNESLALDCGQEILMRISSSLKNFKFRSKFTTWSYVIVRRTIWEFRKNKKRLDSREALTLDASPSSGPQQDRESETASAFDLVDAKQRHAALWAHLEDLPGKQREAVILHYFEDLSVIDAAERMGCSLSSFKTHLYRAREKLKDLIERPEGTSVTQWSSQ